MYSPGRLKNKGDEYMDIRQLVDLTIMGEFAKRELELAYVVQRGQN